MKKTMKTMVLVISILLILNAGAKTINAQNLNNQSKNTVGIESNNNAIDPDSKDN